MLTVKNINTYYDHLQILKDINLTIEDNDLVLIFGPNGHGKSTLLKTICGLVKAKTGGIYYNDINITNYSTKDIVELGIVYIAEDRNLFPDMTVLDNLVLGAYNRRARKNRNQNLEYVLDLFPRLNKYKKRRVRTLSGGEARMCAIARGLMSEPKVLCIDEPSLGLAPLIREEVFETIAKVKENEVSILLVEQTVDEVSDIADRICLMEDGKIVLEGSEEEIFNNDHVKKAFLGI